MANVRTSTPPHPRNRCSSRHSGCGCRVCISLIFLRWAKIHRTARRAACVYARFFLHAITEKEQLAFFDTLSQRLAIGQIAAFEFRTSSDQFLKKHAPPHFRRYQQAKAVTSLMKERGFQRQYLVEGQGFAKYQNEDAIVARCIYKKMH